MEKAIDAVTAKDGDTTQKVMADLQTDGHNVSLREVQRAFARARASLENSSDPWHIDKATSTEELDLILPVIASRIEDGRDPAMSVEEARIVVAIRRAMPNWDPWQADQMARNYRAARHSEWPRGSGSPWTVANLEAFIALAHVERTRPGTLKRAIAADQVPVFGFAKVSSSVIAQEPSKESKRKGGTGNGKKK